MTVIVEQIFMALAQTALAFIAGLLVEHHVISGDQEKTLMQWGLNHAALASPLVAAFLWTLWLKYQGRLKMLIALQPGVHTEDQVNTVLKSGAPTPSISTPSNVSPALAIPVMPPSGGKP